MSNHKKNTLSLDDQIFDKQSSSAPHQKSFGSDKESPVLQAANAHSFLSTNAYSQFNVLNDDSNKRIQENETRIQYLENTLGQFKACDSKSGYVSPIGDGRKFNFDFSDDVVVMELKSNNDLYHDNNIEQSLRSIIYVDEESAVSEHDIKELNQKMTEKQSEGRKKSSYMPSWIEVILLLTIGSVAYLGNSHIKSMNEMSQMVMIINSQAEELKMQKQQIQTLSEKEGYQADFEKDVQHQNTLKISELQANLKNQQREIVKLQQESLEAKQTKKDLAAISTDYDATKERLAEDEKQAKILKADVAKLASVVDRNEGERVKNVEEMTDIGNTVQKQKTEIAGDKAQLVVLRNDIDILQDNAKHTESTLKQMKSVDKEIKGEIKTQGEVDKIDNEAIKNLRDTMGSNKKDLEQLQSEKNDIKQNIQGMEESITGINSYNAQVKEDLNKLNEFKLEMEQFVNEEITNMKEVSIEKAMRMQNHLKVFKK